MKKIKYLLFVLLITILLPISVFAKEALVLKVDKTDIKVGDEITVTANATSKMDTYALMATLKYDQNVFQNIDNDSFAIKSNESIKYNNETNKFGIINKTGKISLKEGDVLFTVHLKVKENANVGNTNIALTNITYTTKDNVQNLETSSLKVLVTKDAEDGETVPTNKENQIVEDEENIIKTYNNIPLIIFLGVLVVIGLITILIINNKSKENSDNNKKKVIYSLIALEVILALITIILLWLNFNKADVNNDGKKDYRDAEEIIDYLIDFEGSTEDSKGKNKTTTKTTKKPVNKYDVNNDGKVDIEDVGNTTEQIEKNTKVTLKEVKEDDEYYVEKGKITLKFTAIITPNEAKITKVKINNKNYKVELVSGVYIVTLDNVNDAGIHNFVIEEVTLSNGVKRNTNLKITKEVLKDRPVVDDLSHDVKAGELSFTIKDKDKALQNARITIFEGNVTEDDIRNSENDSDIYDEDGNLVKPDDFDSFKVVYEEKLDITKKSFTIKPKLNIGGVYTIVITGNYDLDSKIGDNKNYYEEQFLNNGLNIITVGKVSITAKNTDEIFLAKNALENYLFDVEFEPKEIAQTIKQVLVGDEYIDVTYEDGHLKLELNNTKTPGTKNIVISAIKLEDGTDVLCHHEIKYDVLKTKPTITNFVYYKNSDKITFTLEDEDNALKEVNISITDNNEQEVFTEEVSLDTKDISLNNVNLEEGNVYNVNITGEYDLDSDINNDKNNDIASYKQELTVYGVEMTNVLSTYHAEKNEKVELKFKADVTPDNGDISISQITVRNTEAKTSETIIPKKLEDETYSAFITAPDTAGMHNYEIINVSLDNEEIDEKLGLKINVYKDTPVVENLLIDESGTKPKITFDLIDNDNAIDEEHSYLIITNASNKEEIEKIKIKDIAELTENDKNEITYKNEATLSKTTKELEGKSYNLEIQAKYDLHGEGCDMNEQATVSLLNKEFDIYKATLTVDKYDDYVLKNKDIKYTINSEIEPNKESKNITIDSFILDNEDNDVIKASKLENSKYSISLNTLDVAGPKEYKINKVILSNNVEISADATVSVEVLKDAPYINKLNLSEDNRSISYELHDPDNAFTSGTITIEGVDNQSKKEAVQKENTAKIEYEFKDGESYLVTVVGSYDLDSETNGKHEENNKEMSLESFIVGGAYNFTLTNVSITDALKQDEKPVITFKSTNSRSTIVSKANVKIDGKEAVLYDVEKIDKDTYRIVLNGADVSYGKHTVTLDDVSMNNGAKTFVNNKDYHVNELSYSVLKDAPTVKEIKLETNKASKNITAKFSLNDPNYSLRKLNVVLVESSGKIVSSQELLMEEFFTKEEISVTLSYAGSTDGRYTVKVLADYELGDKYLYTNTNIGEETTLVYSEDEIRIDRMYVVNSRNVEQVEGLFPTKKQKDYQIAVEVSVAESVKARGYSRVSGVTINGVNYPAYQISGYKSKVFINIPAEAGILELTASRVQLANDGYYKIYNDYYSVPEKTFKLDVLKDIPKIEDLKVEENYDNSEVTFEFNVVLDKTAEESEFTDGTITLNNDSKSIKVGSNRVTFTNVNRDHTYDLEFKGTYDLDSNKLEGISLDKNKTTNGTFYSVKYGLYDKDVYSSIAIDPDESVLTSAKNNEYFEKNEDIKAKLKISGIDSQLGVTPSKVVINKKEYNLSKLDDDYYELVLDGYSSSGEKTITITDIILSNSKDVKLTNPYTFKPEVLKDNIKVDNYKYNIDNKKLIVNFDLEDPDNAIVGSANAIITDEKGNEKDVKLSNDNYQKEIQIDIEDESILRYYVKVTLDYDRDIDKGENTANHYANVLILDELISLESNNIELKNITDINVYKKEIIDGEESISLKDEISIKDIRDNLDDYFVEVVLENLPDTYAEIKEIKTDNGKLTLVLKYNYVTKDSLKEKTISIDFGTIDGDIANNEFHPGDAFKALLEKLEKGESVTLEQNYDASSYTTKGTSYVTNDYTGNFNGNGYTIKNLNKPLFNIIKNGEVKDVILKDVTLDGKSHGALAKSADNEKVNGVIVDRVTKNSTDGGEGQNGGLLGVARNNSVVENCGVKNVYLNGGGEQQAGGLIGSTDRAEVKNCYVYGTVRGNHNYTAGLVGNALNSTITNNFTNVSLSGPISCDLACGYVQKSAYTNNIALGSGGNRGFTDNANKLENNYYLATSEDKDGIKKITKEEVTADLFKKANFSESIWRLDNVSYDNLPIFKSEKTTSLNAGDNELYDESKNNLYNNLMRLMPFYDSDKIIKVASSVSNDDLNNKTIKHIVPIDKDGHLVTYLTSDNPKKISELKIIFADGTNTEYKVNYDKTYDMVATYKISGLNIDYNYEHYVINAKSQVVVNLTNYLKGLDYTDNLDILTTNDDSRLYRDFYNENTKNNLEEFVLKYLSNSEYTNTTENNAINNYLEKEVKKDKKIEKVLYAYNYFKRFYDLDIDGIKVYDFIMFNMKGFDESLTPDKIAELYLAKPTGENFNTSQTNTRYNEILGNYTNLSTIPKFIEYLVSNLSKHDLSEWTHSQFKGILEEIPIEGASNVKYTLWDHFINESNNEILNQFLPMLTLPEDAAYVISMPVQYIIGAQRTYIVDPSNPQEEAQLRAKMDTYITRMKRYFATAYSILQDDKLFNDILIYSVDKRLTKTESGTSVHNTAYTTTEPFHKNFVEATGLWAAAAGVNAAAWGPRLEWQVAGILDSTLAEEGYNDTSHVTFRTWSHESAHLIDARLFLRNNGRRFDAGGEDYADNFLMQSFDRNSITMNLSMMMDQTANSVEEATEAKLGPVASNLTPERINSPEKIHDFYRKLFETVYAMDYMEAQAFLKLPLETQKILGIQVSYPNETKQFKKVLDENGKDTDQFEGLFYKDDEFAKFRARQTTGYTRLNELEDFNTSLKTMDDLINNRIMLYPGINKFASRGSNSYGGEGINTVHWYQPNNPDGRPDSYSLKWISYEMLGWKGYNNGFVEYASNINYQSKPIYKDLAHPQNGTQAVNFKSDSMALMQISNNKFSSFNSYKKFRFNEIKDKLNRLDNVIKVDTYIDEFYNALIKDATDISNGILTYQYSTAVRHKIYYTLKTKTKDFRDEIFKETAQQTITNLAE